MGGIDTSSRVNSLGAREMVKSSHSNSTTCSRRSRERGSSPPFGKYGSLEKAKPAHRSGRFHNWIVARRVTTCGARVMASRSITRDTSGRCRVQSWASIVCLRSAVGMCRVRSRGTFTESASRVPGGIQDDRLSFRDWAPARQITQAIGPSTNVSKWTPDLAPSIPAPWSCPRPQAFVARGSRVCPRSCGRICRRRPN